MNKNDILVTIAIPIYNAKDYIGYAIQSAINQTYSNWELLLMEDGSNDGSDLIAKSYSIKDSRIKFVSDGLNKGLIYRLNQSINMASGKYYARMDADDIMHVTRIEEEVAYLKSHPEVDVCGSSIMTIDNNNNIIGSGHSEGYVMGFIHPTVMGRTEWFKNNPYSNWALRAEDFELWIRASSTSRFYAIGKPLLFYREFGIPTFHKYYLTQRSLLKIFRRYKVYNKTFFWFFSNSIKTYCKVFIYAFFATIGKLDLLIFKRGRRPLPQRLWLTNTDLGKAIQQQYSHMVQ